MKMRLIIAKLIMLFCMLCYFSAFAQQQLNHQMKYYIDENERLFWNKHMPVYIRISPNPLDSGLLLKSESTKKYTNPYFFDTEGKNHIRSRWATDQGTGQTIYPQMEVLWEVYVDGIPPVSKLVFGKSSTSMKVKEEFFGHDLHIEIQATDETSGVESVFYSINGADYNQYKEPFTLGSEGFQKIIYYAVDRVGNVEKPKERNFKTDMSAPQTYYNITGISEGEIIAITTKIYLSAEDSLSGVQNTFYKIDDGNYQIYRANTHIPVANLSDGQHTLTFYSVDKVGNKEEETVLSFYLDKTAPIVAADILGDRYLLDDKIFFSGRSKMKLTAIDNKAGVEDIYYSVNGEKFAKYEQPFYLPGIPGIHVVRYFATDKMQNNSDAGTSKFEQYKHVVSRIYVDLTGPVLSHEITGDKYKTRDTLFINPKTQIKFKAVDNESGTQYISYSINSEPDETRSNEPLQIAEPGAKHIVYYGYDNVNNRNRAELVVFVDTEGPEIKFNFSISPKGIKDGLEVYPGHAVLYLGATDQVVGAKDIFYSLNQAPEKKYSLSINGFKKASINELKIRAIDFLNNHKELLLKFFVE
jgi:hypothetical protein